MFGSAGLVSGIGGQHNASMPAGPPSNAPRRTAPIPGVEGVRAIAAVSVLVYHCWWYGAEGPSRADLGLVNRFLLPTCPLA
jgi:hypothetical protein